MEGRPWETVWGTSRVPTGSNTKPFQPCMRSQRAMTYTLTSTDTVDACKSQFRPDAATYTGSNKIYILAIVRQYRLGFLCIRIDPWNWKAFRRHDERLRSVPRIRWASLCCGVSSHSNCSALKRCWVSLQYVGIQLSPYPGLRVSYWVDRGTAVSLMLRRARSVWRNFQQKVKGLVITALNATKNTGVSSNPVRVSAENGVI